MMIRDLKIFVAGLLVGILLSVAAFLSYQWHLHQVTATAGSPAKELIGQHTAPVPCSSLQAYPDQSKKQLKLPPAVISRPTQHVVAATVAPASIHNETVTAVTDTATGLTDLYLKPEPLPWIAREHHSHLSFAYGFKDGVPIGRVTFAQDMLQIKALHLGAVGSVDSDHAWFMGAQVSANW